ncbi:hypothetical protein M430DRAFT_187513 [Amorphotheca resinae ATCC 22711]|uniref:Uncharacterized protein n=1 Tax=Amorphotheca resinae ATCC 22711 TaxID=857342 RepID=A0A2T3AQS3_AMORE|nr:hypothetical protein M430DRAFT_187513 [Amorphotheca resinae ATCC 22711]PSS08614.1 hypothetical protein M430DRAFT_187513 [Amorphotheca resinae ATCC 22711]
MTLKCNTQRAGLLDYFGFLRDRYNSIPIILLRTTLQLFFSQVSILLVVPLKKGYY